MVCFDKFLISGSYHDLYIKIWDTEDTILVGIINCRGPINNIFVQNGNQLVINSDEGIFVQPIELHELFGYNRLTLHQSITSEHICFLKEGNKFLAACQENILIQGELSELKNSANFRNKKLEGGKIKRLKLCNK